MLSPDMRSQAAQIARFLTAGVGNTLLTLAIYQLLVNWMTPPAAYTAAWLVGIALVMTVYPKLVFNATTVTALQRIAIAALYVLMYFTGAATVAYLERRFGMRRVSVFIALLITSALNFLGSRYVLKSKR